MAIITGYTAEKMEEFNAASVISGAVNSSGALVLKTRGGKNIDAGNVKGVKGDTGPMGITGGTTASRDAAYPKPTTVAASVTLANQVVTWYNTNTNMFETYYAKTGSSGLKVPGVVGNYGWYENQHMASKPKGPILEQLIEESTGRLETTTATPWFITDTALVNVVAGRRYRLNYRVSSIAASANAALSVEARFSATTDNGVKTGTLIDKGQTIYVAPAAFQGKTHNLEFTWTAPTTGMVRVKLSVSRATLTGYFYFQDRKVMVYDDGQTLDSVVVANPL